MSTAQLLQEKKTILQQLETTNDEELVKRAQQSENDIQNDNVISFKELKELTKKWK